jgi:hypothetical protein
MNRDDIIRFGEQADEVADRKIKMRGEYHPDWHQVRDEAFAALVAAAVAPVCGECGKSAAEGWALYCVSCCEDSMVKAAVAEEREACARIIEGEACAYSEPVWVVEIVNDIRARGEEPKRHPGYIVGDHWLQAAYTRICTGETEDEVMADYGWQRESR